MLSGPQALFGFSFSKSSWIPFIVNFMLEISRIGSALGEVWMLSSGVSRVKTDWNWSFSMLAFPTGFVTSCPVCLQMREEISTFSVLFFLQRTRRTFEAVCRIPGELWPIRRRSSMLGVYASGSLFSLFYISAWGRPRAGVWRHGWGYGCHVRGQGTPRINVRKEIRSWQEENKILGSYMSFYLPLLLVLTSRQLLWRWKMSHQSRGKKRLDVLGWLLSELQSRWVKLSALYESYVAEICIF